MQRRRRRPDQLVDEDRRVYWYDGTRLRARGQLCPEDALYGPMGGGMSLVVREREEVFGIGDESLDRVRAQNDEAWAVIT